MKREIIFKIIIGVIGLLIGLGEGYLLGVANSNKIWQGKFEELKKEREEYKSFLETIFPPLPEEIHTVVGKITKIEGNSFWIETQIRVSRLSFLTGEGIETKEIKVLTNEETKIVKIETPPSQTQYQALPLQTPPKELPLRFEDLEVGNFVLIASDENIKEKTEILAKEIKLVL